MSSYMSLVYFVNIAIVDIPNREEAEVHDASFTNHSESRQEFDKFNSVYGKKLQSPILGYHYQLLDLPTSCIPSTILDTSLLHVRFNGVHLLQKLDIMHV